MAFWKYSIEVQASVSSAYGLMLWSSGYTRESHLNIISYTKLAQFLHVPFNPVIHELRESGSHLFSTAGLCYLSLLLDSMKGCENSLSQFKEQSESSKEGSITSPIFYHQWAFCTIVDWYFVLSCEIHLIFLASSWHKPLWDPSDRDPRKNHNQFCSSSGCFYCGSTLSNSSLQKWGNAAAWLPLKTN